jgi:4-amino-4-deoxy-L-arabinose transferase-like glycosyltransferase
MGSIHGYYFSDHIDVALLFWTELGFWALVRSLRSGLARYYVLAGLGLGLAFLTKVFLAFIIAGVSVTFWVLKRLAPRAAGEWNINVQHLALTAAAALAVVLPWVTYTYSNNPTEFKMNVKLWLLHLTEDMEHWAAPWDRHLFDYMIHELPWIYTLVILGLLFVTVRAVRGRFGEMFLGLWAWGALIPFSLALSKTPADTLIALPALLLAFARVLEQAFRRDNLAHTSLWAAAALAVILIPGGESVVAYRDALPEAERSRLGSYLIANFWVVKQLLVAAAAFVALVVVQRFGGPSYRQRLGVLQVLLALPVTLVIAGLYVVAAGEIIAGPVCRACPALGLPLRLSDSPSFRKMGSVIQETFPKNAVFIMDSKAPFFAGHHFSLMFWSDRSVYHINQLPRHELAAIAMRFQKAGGVPFLVSDKVNAPAEPVGISENGFKIYRLQHPLAETQSKELTSANP